MKLISLNLKCPVCGKSVMDENQLVDNTAGIKLNVKTNGNKGIIWLSAVYGSYNYSCNINIPKDEVVTFSCSHCDSDIKGKGECETCGAEMAHLHLISGGKVNFCLRNGCKDHNIEFDEISTALENFYREFAFNGKNYNPFKQKKEEKNVQKDETKEIIESGTYLNSFCPHCKKSLIENDLIKLKVKADESGWLMLSPYLNIFTSKSTIFLKEQTAVEDLCCPHCNKSLKSELKSCGDCGSPIAKILITAQTKLIDFYLCSKKGCRWHGLNDEDLYEIRLEDSLEW